MKYLVDTDICIYLIKQQAPSVLDKLRACQAGEVGISAVSVAELRYGASKSQRGQANHEALDQFLAPFEIAAFDDAAALSHGAIRAQLERAGQPIGPLDMLIAAQAISLQVTLVTNNLREFERVAGLTVERWA